MAFWRSPHDPLDSVQGSSLESLVAEVADDFVARQQRGEEPDIEDYAARHPHLAAVLRQVLAGLQLVRQSAAGLGVPARPDEAPETGTLGDYRILRQVGRGGMGIVYEAQQISLGRRVALKVLPFAATMDPRQLQRFKNEALASAANAASTSTPCATSRGTPSPRSSTSCAPCAARRELPCPMPSLPSRRARSRHPRVPTSRPATTRPGRPAL